MFNKLYEILKKILKTIFNKTTLAIANILLIIIILISLFVELPYGVYMPGGASSVLKQLSNIKYETSGDIRSTHVSYIGGDIISIIASFFIPNWDIVPVEEMTLDNEDIEQADQRRKIEMLLSANQAIELAYQKAGKKINIVSQKYVINYIYKEAKTNLRIGDEILKYEGKPYVGEEMSAYIATLNAGDTLMLTVKRDGREVITKSEIVEIDGGKYIGVVVATLSEYDKGTVTFEPHRNESGASGGLMMTLAIYNSITKEDISKNRNICGTGTIDAEGNVGEISGVKYKVIGANKDKCDIFLVPAANYEEAIKVSNKYNYKMKIKKVETFDEALEYLAK